MIWRSAQVAPTLAPFFHLSWASLVAGFSLFPTRVPSLVQIVCYPCRHWRTQIIEIWLSFWKTHCKLRIPTTSILWFRFCWSFLDFFTLHKLLQLQKTVCFSGQASFCMIPIWLGFCPRLHTLFCCVKYWAPFTLVTMWYSKSNLQQDLHMLRSHITAYLQVYCINISHNIPILLIAQVAQVAASSVVSRGLHVCTCVKRRRRIQVHICPPSVHTNTNTNTAHADTAK